MSEPTGGPDPPDPDAQTEVVFRTWNDAEAALVAGLLRAAGIPCSSVSDVPHSVYPLAVDGLGEVRLAVASADADAARELIAAHADAARNELDEGDDGP